MESRIDEASRRRSSTTFTTPPATTTSSPRDLPFAKKPVGLQDLDLEKISNNTTETAHHTETGSHGSPSSSPKREEMVSSPLRSTFVEQRDELFFKFGMKLDHFRKRYDQRVKPLRVVTFSNWGATAPTELPEQLGHVISLDEVVQFILPHIVQPASVQNHATTFLRLLTEYPPYVALLQDMYWFFFLEFFALAESEERFDRHRLDILQRLKVEEQSGHGKRRKANDGGSGTKDALDGSCSTAADPLVAPPINSSHPLWKERLGTSHSKAIPSTQRSDAAASAKKKAQGLKPKPINELLVDDDDDDLFESAPAASASISTSSVMASLASSSVKPSLRPAGSLAAGNASQDAQEKRKQAFIKKLKRRQLALLPEHVLSSQQAFDFKYVGEAESTRKSRSVPSPDGRMTDLHVLVEGDALFDDVADARSDSVSVWSVASMPDSVLSARSEDAVDSVPSMSPRRSTTPRVAQLVAQAERCRGKRRLVRGEKNFSQSLAMLVEAEEIELSQSELSALQEEVASRSPEGVAKSQAVIALACDLIGREQFRMFGRMAHNYVTAMRDLKDGIRSIVAPALSDVIARVVTQLLYISAPYARDILTRRARKVIKRKISYWIGGVESASVDDWGDGVAVPIDDAHRGEMHAYYTRKWGAMGLNVPSTPQSRRISETITVTPRRNRRASLRIPSAPPAPLMPVTLPSSSSTCTPTASLAASVNYQSGRAKRMSASLNASPISARGPRRGQVNFPPEVPNGDGLTLSGDGSVHNEGVPDLNASAAFTWSHGAVAYHKALDEILEDFDKMQSGTDGGGGSAQRAIPSKPQGAPPSSGGGGQANRGRRGGSRQVEEVKHLETHRHAPVNRRSELWHEQGRASYAAVNSESRSRQGQFDLGNVSPFMKRYLRDSSVAAFEGHHQKTSTRLIKWTSS